MVWEENRDIDKIWTLMGSSEYSRQMKPVVFLSFSKNENIREPIKKGLDFKPILKQRKTTYWEKFQFDPSVQKKINKLPDGKYYYEKALVITDEIFLEWNLQASIRIEVYQKHILKSRLIFRRGNTDKAKVPLFLVEIDGITFDIRDEYRLLKYGQLLPARMVSLPPEEHFVTIYQYFSKIFSKGLLNTLVESFYDNDIHIFSLPYGINKFGLQAIFQALGHISVDLQISFGRKFFEKLRNRVPKPFFQENLENFIKYTSFSQILFSDSNFYQHFSPYVNSNLLRQLSDTIQNKDPLIVKQLLNESDWETRRELLKSTKNPLSTFQEEIAGEKDLSLRLQIQKSVPIYKEIYDRNQPPSEYQGVPINEDQIQIINRFFQITGEVLDRIQNPGMETGFFIEDGMITGISLRGIKLSPAILFEVKQTMQDLSQLKFLNLDSTGLKSIPREISSLSNLEKLWMRNNFISQIPQSLDFPRGLRGLFLHKNQITIVSWDSLKACSIVELDLGHNQIHTIPDDISEFPQIRRLDFSFNGIGDTLYKLFTIESLEFLSIAGNYSTQLSPKISQLVRLKELYLNGMNLEGLPNEIGQLGELEKIDFAWNKIHSFPENFFNLKNLRILDASYNLLSEIPDEISGLENLEKLDLRNNKLHSLPFKIGLLPKLSSLRIDNNKINELSKSLLQIKNLKITAEDNPLTFVPPEVKKKIVRIGAVDWHPKLFWKLDVAYEELLNFLTEHPGDKDINAFLMDISGDLNRLIWSDFPPLEFAEKFKEILKYFQGSNHIGHRIAGTKDHSPTKEILPKLRNPSENYQEKVDPELVVSSDTQISGFEQDPNDQSKNPTFSTNDESTENRFSDLTEKSPKDGSELDGEELKNRIFTYITESKERIKQSVMEQELNISPAELELALFSLLKQGKIDFRPITIIKSPFSQMEEREWFVKNRYIHENQLLSVLKEKKEISELQLREESNLSKRELSLALHSLRVKDRVSYRYENEDFVWYLTSSPTIAPINLEECDEFNNTREFDPSSVPQDMVFSDFTRPSEKVEVFIDTELLNEWNYSSLSKFVESILSEFSFLDKHLKLTERFLFNLSFTTVGDLQSRNLPNQFFEVDWDLDGNARIRLIFCPLASKYSKIPFFSSIGEFLFTFLDPRMFNRIQSIWNDCIRIGILCIDTISGRSPRNFFIELFGDIYSHFKLSKEKNWPAFIQQITSDLSSLENCRIIRDFVSFYQIISPNPRKVKELVFSLQCMGDVSSFLMTEVNLFSSKMWNDIGEFYGANDTDVFSYVSRMLETVNEIESLRENHTWITLAHPVLRKLFFERNSISNSMKKLVGIIEKQKDMGALEQWTKVNTIIEDISNTLEENVISQKSNQFSPVLIESGRYSTKRVPVDLYLFLLQKSESIFEPRFLSEILPLVVSRYVLADIFLALPVKLRVLNLRLFQHTREYLENLFGFSIQNPQDFFTSIVSQLFLDYSQMDNSPDFRNYLSKLSSASRDGIQFGNWLEFFLHYLYSMGHHTLFMKYIKKLTTAGESPYETAISNS